MSPEGESLARLYTPERRWITEIPGAGYYTHGSEEVTIQPQCRALHNGVSNTLDEHDKLSSPSELDPMREMLLSGEQQMLHCGEHPSTEQNPKEWRHDPRDWNMADAITWLEEQKVAIKGIEVCRENAINGPLLIHILASENRQQKSLLSRVHYKEK